MTATSLLPGVDVLTFGEAMLSLRTTSRLTAGSAVTASVAGAEANAAIGLARLGHTVRWVGRVGADGPGDLVLRVLRGEGVDAVAHVDPQAPTGALLFEQRLPDVTAVTYWRNGSAGAGLSLGDLSAALDAGCRVLLASGITCALSPQAAEAVAAAVRHAKQAGACVAFDVNYRSKLWPRSVAREILSPIATQADIVFGSPDELDLLAGEGLGAAPLLAAGVSEVVVKLGAQGACRIDRSGRHCTPALRVIAVDSVGAGDGFVAGYLSGWLDGLGGEDRLRRANAAGACVVATHGDWEGLPTRGDLELFTAGPGHVVR